MNALGSSATRNRPSPAGETTHLHACIIRVTPTQGGGGGGGMNDYHPQEDRYVFEVKGIRARLEGPHPLSTLSDVYDITLVYQPMIHQANWPVKTIDLVRKPVTLEAFTALATACLLPPEHIDPAFAAIVRCSPPDRPDPSTATTDEACAPFLRCIEGIVYFFLDELRRLNRVYSAVLLRGLEPHELLELLDLARADPVSLCFRPFLPCLLLPPLPAASFEILTHDHAPARPVVEAQAVRLYDHCLHVLLPKSGDTELAGSDFKKSVPGVSFLREAFAWLCQRRLLIPQTRSSAPHGGGLDHYQPRDIHCLDSLICRALLAVRERYNRSRSQAIDADWSRYLAPRADGSSSTSAGLRNQQTHAVAISPPPLDEEQRTALDRLLEEPIASLIGGAGTGKTTMLAHMTSHFPSAAILLCAPTNKAARVLTERVGPASTIHRLVHRLVTMAEAAACPSTSSSSSVAGGSSSSSTSSAPSLPIIDPVAVRVLICDEASMVSTNLFAYLLETCRQCCPNLSHVYLVGDAGQLPSVEPGRILLDFVDVFPAIRLERNRRVLGESATIFRNVERVRRLDAELEWTADCFKLMEITAESVEQNLCDTIVALGGDPWDTQIITPLRKDASRLNEVARLCYRDPGALRTPPPALPSDASSAGQAQAQPQKRPIATSSASSSSWTKPVFQIGDKLMCTQNLHALGICNGDFFKLTEIHAVRFELDTPKTSGHSRGPLPVSGRYAKALTTPPKLPPSSFPGAAPKYTEVARRAITATDKVLPTERIRLVLDPIVTMNGSLPQVSSPEASPVGADLPEKRSAHLSSTGRAPIERNTSATSTPIQVCTLDVPLHAFTHGYCATIHKFQGCEARNIIFVMPTAHSSWVTSAYVYTALSRARQNVATLAPRGDLARAIRVPQRERHSVLALRLRNLEYASLAEFFSYKQDAKLLRYIDRDLMCGDVASDPDSSRAPSSNDSPISDLKRARV